MTSNSMMALANTGYTRALITGVGGFLGRALSRHLLQGGTDVMGLDVHDSPRDLPKGVRYHQIDLVNLNDLYHGLKRWDLENAVVFHLAGQSHVGKSRTDPLATISTNVSGTAHLLEACRVMGVGRIIFPSTALVYAKPTPEPVRETHPVQAGSLYAATKLACEALLRGFASDFGFVCCIARLGNVYGPDANADSVVQTILLQVKEGGPVSVRTLAPVRDFVYRDDVVSGLIALASHACEVGCEVVNLSSGIPTSIRELADVACSVSHVKPDIVETDPQSADEDDKLVLSIERIKECAGWQPSWLLEDGVRRTLFELESGTH